MKSRASEASSTITPATNCNTVTRSATAWVTPITILLFPRRDRRKPAAGRCGLPAEANSQRVRIPPISAESHPQSGAHQHQLPAHHSKPDLFLAQERVFGAWSPRRDPERLGIAQP